MTATGRAPARVDAELVRRGLARSRGQARELLAADRVRLQGRAVTKPATPVTTDDALHLVGEPDPWVSRAAHKLVGALDEFDVQVSGRRCIDVGASTGGFTQVLLQAGAASVCALDVGHGQLVSELGTDPRVDERSGLSVRDVSPSDVGGPFDVLVTDLSFISLTVVADRLASLVRPDGDVLALIKPQFEVGRGRLGKGGVVQHPDLRREAIEGVVEAFDRAGLRPQGLTTSPIVGTEGNSEYLVWCVHAPDRPSDLGPWRTAARRLTEQGDHP